MQRRLERDTDKLLNTLRDQRNTPSGGGSQYGIGQWAHDLDVANERFQLEKAERRAQERETRLSDERWKRDHPNETREQYTAREKMEKDARIEARIEAERIEEIALYEARLKAAEEERNLKQWAQYSDRESAYTARERPPEFTTPADDVAWSSAHNRTAPNPWAATNAAIYLIDGIGVPTDRAEAARLVAPHSRVVPEWAAGLTIRNAPHAVCAYLRARYPETCVPLGFPADPAAGRRDLEALAPANAAAAWYLARLLSESSELADQNKALQFFPLGYRWALDQIGMFIGSSHPGSRLVRQRLKTEACEILQRTTAAFPEALHTWPLNHLLRFENLIAETGEPFRTNALMLFSDTIAERFVSPTPAQPFPYGFSELLVAAGHAGCPSVYGLAVLERNHLLSFDRNESFIPPWSMLDNRALAFEALARWASRNDALGARARIALATLDHAVVTSAELPEALAWRSAFKKFTDLSRADELAEERTNRGNRANRAVPTTVIPPATVAATVALDGARTAAHTAFAHRDATAPTRDSLASQITLLENALQGERDLNHLNGFAYVSEAPDPALFAVESANFDLDRADAYFVAAFPPAATNGAAAPAVAAAVVITPATAALNRHRALFAATRLGDAFAPLALARDRSASSLTAAARERLTILSDARRARDEAGLRSRARAARLIMAHLHNEELEPMLTQAAAAGSALAARFQLHARIGNSISRVGNDVAPSWELAPALIAELDAAVIGLEARPDAFTDWHLLSPLLLDEETAARAAGWFYYIDLWKADRQERLADAALIRAIKPEFEAIIATLGQWPGMDYSDSRNDAWIAQGVRDNDAATALVATDGIGALKLFLHAAGRGNRAALEELSLRLRDGSGQLPRSAEFADLLVGAIMKIVQADAEVGDTVAASYLGSSLIYGRGVAQDRAAGLAWLGYAAHLGDHDAASKRAGHASADQDPRAARHWTAVGEAIQMGELLPLAPRRQIGEAIDLTPIRPQLEAALTAANRWRSEATITPLSAAEEKAESTRYAAAFDLYQTDRAGGLVALAQSAARGSKYAAFAVAQILGGGRYGPQPELTRGFHAIGIALVQLNAEQGDGTAAQRVGIYYLELAEKTDPVAAIRWLTYSAELGEGRAAESLAELYTLGAPGLAPDPAKVRQWQTLAAEINLRQHLRIPPLRRSGPSRPLTPISPALQAALAVAQRATTVRPPTDSDADVRVSAAYELVETDPAAGFIALAQLAGQGHGAEALALASMLSAGDYGFEPDPELARQFQVAGLALVSAETEQNRIVLTDKAERGDADAARELGHLYQGKSDIAAAIRWLTYAAERGNVLATTDLSRIYADGADGLAPDLAAAARWNAFRETIEDKNFKPRAPLR